VIFCLFEKENFDIFLNELEKQLKKGI